ncbi:aspartate aminotransferase/aromatic-amino-acid transaminase [Quadrisphaera granulorum]|uniref:Aspartate aminotransferase/aromatic-amino-acid transaminase n=1 Tax=Quadrisphaera granulorum TaxID=317664 RepID=A0A315ZTD0_9ACTN|nr:aspartate aminotransferase/aromatic-amino-acid transaminase [Quadrisphaera granulorum]SZE98287.1 aspartate aminotransferase/aromatic-amino-acid transaminase [Quadrisphaera granulorum]
MARAAADRRPGALDLTVGVYRDDDGRVPVMEAVARATDRLAARRGSKAYQGMAGNPRFTTAMTSLLLGSCERVERAATVQTVAGTGALRLLAELVAVASPTRRVLLGTPAYVNHVPLLRAAGLTVVTHPWTTSTGALDEAALLTAVRSARPGDVYLVQGCCHNPTGTSMSLSLWDSLATACLEAGVTPFVDMAYYGLGDGLDADLAGLRLLVDRVPEVLVAVSASKAFGLYSERTGCAVVVGASDGGAGVAAAQTVLESTARSQYSQPPGHGAELVAEILDDDDLRSLWRAELDGAQVRLTRLREALVAELCSRGAVSVADVVSGQRGMFLQLPLTPSQMEVLRVEHAVHGMPGGRINLAGVPASSIERLAAAVAEISGTEVSAAGRDAVSVVCARGAVQEGQMLHQ